MPGWNLPKGIALALDLGGTGRMKALTQRHEEAERGIEPPARGAAAAPPASTAAVGGRDRGIDGQEGWEAGGTA